MTDTMKRVLTAGAMIAVAGAAVWLDFVRWLAAAVAVGMAIELFAAMRKSKANPKGSLSKQKRVAANAAPAGKAAGFRRPGGGFGFCSYLFFALYSVLLVVSAWGVGAKPWIMLLLLLTIAAADTGAWFFGRRLGGDKLWERVSPNKTWAGQIAGIICGTCASVLYGMLGTDVFLASLMWIGIGVSLMSQYGDLAASAIKRRLGIKDFSRILPGHGGLLDRFDGWIFVLPIVRLATL
jgi:phosphatidate cytidylyltransferase